MSASVSSGSFDPVTNIWSVPSINNGASIPLTINWRGDAFLGDAWITTAEIIASDSPDFDSIPNNGVTTEDDYVAQTINVVAGRSTPAPMLVCFGNSTVMD